VKKIVRAYDATVKFIPEACIATRFCPNRASNGELREGRLASCRHSPLKAGCSQPTVARITDCNSRLEPETLRQSSLYR
jgi:hypothetical protein